MSGIASRLFEYLFEMLDRRRDTMLLATIRRGALGGALVGARANLISRSMPAATVLTPLRFGGDNILSDARPFRFGVPILALALNSDKGRTPEMMPSLTDDDAAMASLSPETRAAYEARLLGVDPSPPALETAAVVFSGGDGDDDTGGDDAGNDFERAWAALRQNDDTGGDYACW